MPDKNKRLERAKWLFYIPLSGQSMLPKKKPIAPPVAVQSILLEGDTT